MTSAIKVGALSCAIAAALFFAWWGVSIASKVFDDYKDNSDGAYLFIGGLLFALGIGAVVFPLMAGLPQHMTRGQVALSLPIGIALFAGTFAYFYYGPPSNSVPDHHRGPPPPARTSGDLALPTVTIGTSLPQR